ncbi:ergothioneine biosynthesis protein EgtB [Shewanella surugensis]|uniref:Ergothioneine biosynthesis protein EgtB n=1 Tax=Shewanella surugensis TaxID=212020 RepID=A0ABT0LIG3_9GAMM|nr:ergothioneine biosynthesis protein EgtB [Shewanella surugensis]MCL1127260.1 ergothioneine biosynthesis protein EgtB [Shewanella surugensis]
MMNIHAIKSLFLDTRQHSILACEALTIEDANLQAATFTSPPKWHLAHTTWFFETFILKTFAPRYKPFHAAYEVLFNSYYQGVGEQYPRAHRGLLSRPHFDEVLTYREVINQVMVNLIEQITHPEHAIIIERCLLGIQHEKQHQELLLTDIKYSLSRNPLLPAVFEHSLCENNTPSPQHWIPFDAGLIEIGVNTGELGFAFDNESPKHHVYLTDFSLSNRLVTNGEFQAFIDDGGYQRPELWLADGWSAVQQNRWEQPLYWQIHEGRPMHYTLFGLQERHDDQPLNHISGFEADAYANWAGARLPTEAEWEHAAKQQVKRQDINISSIDVHPPHNARLLNLYGHCWQWTSSAYRPYPGFKTAKGTIGEYNGKFMCNQWVLKGGSTASPDNHLRASYRNFFYPEQRWQFSGIRLAK